MKKILTVVIIALASLKAISQNLKADPGKFNVGIGVSLAVPVNNLETNTIGAGLDLLAQYGLDQNLAVTADAGLTALFAKYDIPTTAIIPIRIGVRYFPASAVYLGAKTGLGIYTLGDIVSENYAAWSLGAGYLLDKRFDVSASYDGYVKKGISFGYMALRIGYAFGK
jgi:Outer membrane protein beta-barrel domain